MNSFRYRLPYHDVCRRHDIDFMMLLEWMRKNCGTQGINWCISTRYNICFRYKRHYTWFILRWS
jgi:hypothetical protein